jgi:hypothetical protein
MWLLSPSNISLPLFGHHAMIAAKLAIVPVGRKRADSF